MSSIGHLLYLANNHQHYIDREWHIIKDIGSPSDPVTFMIAGNSTVDIDSFTGEPLRDAFSGDIIPPNGTPFRGSIRGIGSPLPVIHLDIVDDRPNGITGFIGHIEQNSAISEIHLAGSVRGDNVVGGLVGWSQNTNIHTSNVTNVIVGSYSSPPPGDFIAGQLIGVAYPWSPRGRIGHNVPDPDTNPGIIGWYCVLTSFGDFITFGFSLIPEEEEEYEEEEEEYEYEYEDEEEEYPKPPEDTDIKEPEEDDEPDIKEPEEDEEEDDEEDDDEPEIDEEAKEPEDVDIKEPDDNEGDSPIEEPEDDNDLEGDDSQYDTYTDTVEIDGVTYYGHGFEHIDIPL